MVPYAVAGKIDAAIPPHGRFARAWIITGQGNNFGLASLIGFWNCKFPDVLGCAAFVPFRVAAMKRQAGKREHKSIRRKDTVASLA